MTVRYGLISNSSACSFIIPNTYNGHANVLCKDKAYSEEWSKEDVQKWIISMYKRESRKYNSKYVDFTDDQLKEYVKIYDLKDVIEKYRLPFWYAGYELTLPECKWLIYCDDNIFSEELTKKICKKFSISSYHPHMG